MVRIVEPQTSILVTSGKDDRHASGPLSCRCWQCDDFNRLWFYRPCIRGFDQIRPLPHTVRHHFRIFLLIILPEATSAYCFKLFPHKLNECLAPGPECECELSQRWWHDCDTDLEVGKNAMLGRKCCWNKPRQLLRILDVSR
jgi:hypothetical protein